jgi:hypothetical protein
MLVKAATDQDQHHKGNLLSAKPAGWYVVQEYG